MNREAQYRKKSLVVHVSRRVFLLGSEGAILLPTVQIYTSHAKKDTIQPVNIYRYKAGVTGMSILSHVMTPHSQNQDPDNRSSKRLAGGNSND